MQGESLPCITEGWPESQFCQRFSPWVSMVAHLQPVLLRCRTDSGGANPTAGWTAGENAAALESHAMFAKCSIFLRKEHLAPSQTDKKSLENPDPPLGDTTLL